MFKLFASIGIGLCKVHVRTYTGYRKDTAGKNIETEPMKTIVKYIILVSETHRCIS